MKILEHGTKDTKLFVCLYCGCRFEAAQDEYWTDKSVYINSINKTYRTCCPECHKICTSYDTDGCCCAN